MWHDETVRTRADSAAITTLRAALAIPEQLVVGGDDLPTLTKWTPMSEYPRMQEEIDELRAGVFDPDWDRVKALEESLREHMAEIQRLKALAQPEPMLNGLTEAETNASASVMGLTPPQRKPLTDEEVDTLSRTMVKGGKSVNWLCRAIEKAHGIGEQND